MEFNEFKNHITFFKYVDYGPYPDEKEEKELYSCFCKIYNSTSKDVEVLKTTKAKTGLNLVIRDVSNEYFPNTKHLIKIDKSIYANKLFNITEVYLNKPRENYITLLVTEV